MKQDPPSSPLQCYLVTSFHSEKIFSRRKCRELFDIRLARGQQRLAAGQPREALRDFETALEYPDNLEAGRARRAPRSAQVQHLIGDVSPDKVRFKDIESNIVRCPDQAVAAKMIRLIEKMRRAGDSVGGIIEGVARGDRVIASSEQIAQLINDRYGTSWKKITVVSCSIDLDRFDPAPRRVPDDDLFLVRVFGSDRSETPKR